MSITPINPVLINNAQATSGPQAKPVPVDHIDLVAKAVKLLAVIQSEDAFAIEYATRKMNKARKDRLIKFLNTLNKVQSDPILKSALVDVELAPQKTK